MVSKAEKGEAYGPLDGCFNLILTTILALATIIGGIWALVS